MSPADITVSQATLTCRNHPANVFVYRSSTAKCPETPELHREPESVKHLFVSDGFLMQLVYCWSACYCM